MSGRLLGPPITFEYGDVCFPFSKREFVSEDD